MVRLRNTATANTTTAKRRTGKVGAVVAAVASVAGMVFAAAPAAAAYPTSTFEVPYGASFYNGTATWYNRSVSVTGTFRATGCRRIYARAFAGSNSLAFVSSSTWCGKTAPATLSLITNVPGGADNLWVYMTDETGKYLHGQTCYRGASTCIDGRH